MLAAWQRGQVPLVCATIAMGMGVDVANVRFILHATMAKSVEGYYQARGRWYVCVSYTTLPDQLTHPHTQYSTHQQPPQEAGRAGRDGQPARCVLFYRKEDVSKLKNLILVGRGGGVIVFECSCVVFFFWGVHWISCLSSYACRNVCVYFTTADLRTTQRHHTKQGPFGRKRRGRGGGVKGHELAKLQDMRAYCEEQVSCS